MTTPATAAVRGRVLIIVENLPVPFDRRVWQEATALRQAGYGVSVICPKGKGYDRSFEIIDGVEIHRHPLPPEGRGAIGYLREYSAALLWEFILSCRVLRRTGFDVIHACNPPDLIFAIALFHKVVFGKKFLFDQHDINPELYEVKFGKRGFFHRLLRVFERLTFLCADGSLATNETLKRRAIDKGRMNADRVWVVQSFPDLARFQPTEPDPQLLPEFRHRVGYVGIMAEQDGVDMLVKAMAHIVHGIGRADIGCTIIGDGPELERLKTLATELNVSDAVQFTGYLSGSDLLSKLCACDVGVIPDPPNACNEKLSMNKVFEYMALGLPFVQFDLTQAKEEAGAAALVVSQTTPEALAEGIVALVDDPARRASMSEYGRRRAEREFQWQREKQALIAAYETLLSDPAPIKTPGTVVKPTGGVHE